MKTVNKLNWLRRVQLKHVVVKDLCQFLKDNVKDFLVRL